MLDLVEGNKVVVGLAASTMGIAKGACDYINMEGMHTIYAVATFKGTSGPVLTPLVAEDYTGTSSSSGEAIVWTNYDTTTLDRWTKSTALFATLEDGNEGAAILRFDPASAASTNKYFAIHRSSCVGPLSVTYIAQPRYAGYQQTIATTSST
jgi:hypothetical protein